MVRAVPVIVALALVIGYGVAEGVSTHRWWASADLDRAAARLADVPKTVGDWEGTDKELDARQVAVARLSGYVSRTYVRRGSNETVTVLLLCGPGGPVSVHTPDVCFAGVGYTTKADAKRHTADAPGLVGPAEFMANRFDAPAGADALGIMWGWSTAGRWEAPDNPRVAFGPEPAVYKLYLVRPLSDPAAHPAQDRVLAEFAKVFLPAAQAALFPPAN